MTAARLELRNLSKRFGGTQVIDDLSLSVEEGTITCLLGPSGCGKSTTLRIVAGVERQDSGEVLVAGNLICSPHIQTPPEARSIGLMFQDFALFPHLTAAENVGFGLTLPKGAASQRVDELLDRVGLLQLATKYPHQLSGGEQQRVALARALAPKPGILLMDEPFSGLDNRLRDEIRDDTIAVLRQENTAVLLVTHEPEEAMRMGDNIALMRDGKIVQHGAPRMLYNAPVDKRAASFFSDINSLPAEVQNGLVSTPLGEFVAPKLPDGEKLEVVFRPQHLKLLPVTTGMPGAHAKVERSRHLGRDSLIELRLSEDGSLLKFIATDVFLPSKGTVFMVSLPPNKAMIFQKSVGLPIS